MQPMQPETFARAYSQGFRLTVGFLRSKGANPDTAEEVAQTAWARGWEALSTLRSGSKIVPWVNSIAYHRFCNDQRRAAQQRQLTDAAGSHDTDRNAVLDAGTVLKLCSPPERELLTMKYLEGMETREIAATQGLTEVAVRVRLHRCHASLRALLGFEDNQPAPALVRKRKAVSSAVFCIAEPQAA